MALIKIVCERCGCVISSTVRDKNSIYYIKPCKCIAFKILECNRELELLKEQVKILENTVDAVSDC